ncbi:MAG: sensor histidine kinase [Thermoanaerobaculia bacterium]
MTDSSRGLLSSGLLLLAVLLVVAAGGGAQGNVPRLAVVAGGSVALRALFLAPGVRRAFGAFAVPIDLGTSLVLVLFALSLTGGLASDLYPLLLVEIVLARRGEGPPAGRFLAVAATAGVALLAIPGVTGGAPLTVGTALRVAWPAALLLVLEVADRGATSAPAEIGSPPTPPPASSAGPEPASLARDPRKELLHDLKSPLSVVRVYADLMTEAARRGELARPEHLESLSNEISLMEALVGVARPAASASVSRPASPPRTDLVKLLSTLASSYRDAHGEKLRIEFVSDEESIVVAADPVAVQRALRNILDNAVKYTPPGGQVRMRASIVTQHVFVVISDTGIGMTREEQKHAFEYAYRGEAARASGAEGRGLGLALVRELLEAQGGKISLLSEPGHGFEVTIMFPLPRDGNA